MTADAALAASRACGVKLLCAFSERGFSQLGVAGSQSAGNDRSPQLLGSEFGVLAHERGVIQLEVLRVAGKAVNQEIDRHGDSILS